MSYYVTKINNNNNNNNDMHNIQIIFDNSCYKNPSEGSIEYEEQYEKILLYT
jgi:hypothetical protein